METVFVSQPDLARTQLFNWLAKEDERGIWHIYTDVSGVHHALDQMIVGCNSQQSVDHLDGDDFNCCRKNLEVVEVEELVERRLRRVTGVSVGVANRSPF